MTASSPRCPLNSLAACTRSVRIAAPARHLVLPRSGKSRHFCGPQRGKNLEFAGRGTKENSLRFSKVRFSNPRSGSELRNAVPAVRGRLREGWKSVHYEVHIVWTLTKKTNQCIDGKFTRRFRPAYGSEHPGKTGVAVHGNETPNGLHMGSGIRENSSGHFR